MEFSFKLTIIILTINSFSFCKSEILPIKSEENLISIAATEIIKHSLSKYSNIHIISNYQNNTFDDIVSELIFSAIKNSKVAVENARNFNEKLRRHAAIIVMDSRDAVLDLVGKVKNIEKRGRHLIIFPNASHADLETIFTLLWKFYIFNVGILTEKADAIEWSTFLPFDAGKCGDTTPKTISKFIKRDKFWKNSLFYPRKLKNLNGCDLKIGTFYTIPTAIVENGTVYGSEADALINIGKIMNYRPKYFIFSRESGVVYENGSGTGLMQRALNREVDVIHGFLSLQHLRARFLTASKSYAQVPLAIVVPPGNFITPVDKLLYPFSPGIWYALVAMYIVVFSVIGIFGTFFEESYNFLVGKNIKNPNLSMLIVCLGFTQHKLPGRNFSRFTLMNFMLFWLVVRTCYQGVLFNLLQKVMLKFDSNSSPCL